MTAGQLNCRVYVDSQDAGHRLFDVNWSSTGAKLAAADTHSGALATILALLKDGAAHTFYFFFWVDSGDGVISVCQLWEGVGTSDTGYWGVLVLALSHTGLVSVASRIAKEGTGTYKQMLLDGAFTQSNFITNVTSNDIYSFGETACVVKNGVNIQVGGSVATDLNYLYGCSFVLRGEK